MYQAVQQCVVLCVGPDQGQPRWRENTIFNTHSSSSSLSDVPIAVSSRLSSLSLDTLEDLRQVEMSANTDAGMSAP